MSVDFYRNWSANVLHPFVLIQENRPGTALELLLARIAKIMIDKQNGNFDGEDAVMLSYFSSGAALVCLLNKDTISAQRHLDSIQPDFPSYKSIKSFITFGFQSADIQTLNTNILVGLEYLGKELAKRYC